MFVSSPVNMDFGIVHPTVDPSSTIVKAGYSTEITPLLTSLLARVHSWWVVLHALATSTRSLGGPYAVSSES